MKAQILFFSLLALSTPGLSQQFRLPTPPTINFGKFRPILKAIFRPSFFRPGFINFRRPPPPLPPPLDPLLHPPVLQPIHSPLKQSSHEGFDGSFRPSLQELHFKSPPHSVMKAPPSLKARPQSFHHGFGAPKPETIITIDSSVEEISSGKPLISGNDVVIELVSQHSQGSQHEDDTLEHLPKPLALKRIPEPKDKLAPPPLRLNGHDLGLNDIQQPSKAVFKPATQNSQHLNKHRPKTQILKLKPIKMINKPHIHFAPPPSKANSHSSNLIRDNLKPFGKPQSQVSSLPLKFHQSHIIRPPVQNTIAGFHNPPSSFPLKSILNQNFNSQVGNKPELISHAVFVSKKPTDVGNLLSSTGLGFANPPSVSNNIDNHVISQVPKVNAGVLPLANEIDEPPNLWFPPFVKPQ